ncbi:MAG: transposase [Treponema sp.]|jgi:transposase-like protein|nr:transposase [Treponema sp.]
MKRYTNEGREKHVAAWKTSGLARSAYAREQGIHPTTFCKWVKKGGQKGHGFVELPKMSLYQGNGEIEIEKGDIHIHLPTEMLETVLKAVFDNSGRLS